MADERLSCSGIPSIACRWVKSWNVNDFVYIFKRNHKSCSTDREAGFAVVVFSALHLSPVRKDCSNSCTMMNKMFINTELVFLDLLLFCVLNFLVNQTHAGVGITCFFNCTGMHGPMYVIQMVKRTFIVLLSIEMWKQSSFVKTFSWQVTYI